MMFLDIPQKDHKFITRVYKEKQNNKTNYIIGVLGR